MAFALLIISLIFSTILAYKYPKITIALTIIFGQIIQYELAPLLGIHDGTLSTEYFNLRLSDPLLFGIIVTITVKLCLGHKLLIRFLITDGLWLSIFILNLAVLVLVSIPLYGINSLGEFRSYYQFLFYVPYTILSINNSHQIKRFFQMLLFLSFIHIITGLLRGAILFDFKFAAYDKWITGYGSLALLYGVYGLYISSRFGVLRIKKFTKGVIALIGIILIIISGTRAVWLAGAMGLGVIIIIDRYPATRAMKILLVFLLTLLAILPLSDYSGYNIIEFITERTTAYTDYQKDPTARWRYHFWIEVLNQIRNDIFVGSGFGKYFDVYIKEYNEIRTTEPHNLYLTIIYHVGIIGILFYLLFIIKIMHSMIINSNKLNVDKYIVVMAILVLVSIHSYGIAYSFAKDFYTWLYIGLGIAAINMHRTGKQ
jgi:O-antigen ligase